MNCPNLPAPEEFLVPVFSAGPPVGKNCFHCGIRLRRGHSSPTHSFPPYCVTMSYGNGTVLMPIVRRVFIGALVGIYAYAATDVVLIPGYAQLMQKWKKGSSTPAHGGGH
ncbi:putative transmembrane protein [Toxoplasma gondii CAST]|uniref:Putative transmembrane protein n=2 Tax=Toxoplasma gondii TaxID=5811 RepID=A0A425I1T8_TOXGO|nr:putative transmembrane protein [Toxoplasma gondii CAST]